jgi:hypothetical protein
MIGTEIVKKILNKIGFYKIDQLQVGGYCGICGKFVSNKITVVEEHGWIICDKH